jgi:hypothetical protein
MGKKSRSGFGIWIRDEHLGSYFRELRNYFWVKILKIFDADPVTGNLFDPGSGIRDGKNSDPESATLTEKLSENLAHTASGLQNFELFSVTVLIFDK